MTVFIYGGSNSLRKGGWTAYLAKELPDENVINRSIGAATTLMALFRLLTNPETGPKAGDTVIWEYALNEVNHIARGYDREIVSRNVARFIHECTRRQLKLVAAIFTPRNEEWAADRHAMYQDLATQLDAHGVASFDASLAWRRHSGQAHVAKHFFKDAAHYGDDAEFLTFLAKGVKDCLRRATVPVPKPDHSTAPRPLVVQLVKADSEYKNALISVPLAAHRATMELGCNGRLIGAATLVFPDTRSALRLEYSRSGHAGKWVNLSTAGIDKADKPILKVFSLEMAGADWQVQAGDQVDILPLRRAKPIYAESHVRANLAAMDATQPHAFIGFVIEQD